MHSFDIFRIEIVCYKRKEPENGKYNIKIYMVTNKLLRFKIVSMMSIECIFNIRLGKPQKKVTLLVAWPLRPYPPPSPLE